MKMIISGGGTGGHIYPALAIAREVLRREPDSQILYIGTKKGLESDLVPKENIPFEAVEITGFKRSLSFENVKTIWRFIKATKRAKKLIADFKPDVVVGTGGYVCGPVVYAASSLKVPTLIHEQNVIPGLTNKFLSRYTNRIAVSFSGSAEYFPKGKTVVTGNPRATEVVRADGEKGLRSLQIPSGKKVVLIVGGSRGARAINEAVSEMIPLIGNHQEYHFIYVTGEVHYQGVQDQIQKLASFPGNLTLRPFIYNMPEVLAGIDLIVNRAGASFLAEITALGIPSILIPSPYVTNNHQEKNARWVERQGAGMVILETELTGKVLLQTINQILSNPQVNQKMGEAAKSLGQPEAATLIYEQLKAITRS